jgi:hypothetical protein
LKNGRRAIRNNFNIFYIKIQVLKRYPSRGTPL